jgi:amino acid adenylation domain-containing protein
MSRHDERVLSAAQRRLWLAAKVAPDSCEFTVVWAMRVRGPLDSAALARAWRSVLGRHSELRLRVADRYGEPCRDSWPAEVLDLTVRATAASDVDSALDAAAARVFALDAEPLVDLTLLRCGAEDHVVLFTAHHIVVDGRAMRLIVDDLFGTYAGAARAPAPRGYEEFVAWEAAERPAHPRFGEWLDGLRVPAPPRPVGLGDVRPEHTKRAGEVSVPVGAPMLAEIRAAARANRTTPQVMGMTAVGLTLREYTGATEVVLGATMDARPTDFADTVGMFVNPAPVRLDLPQGRPVPDLLAAAQRSLLTAHAQRHVPFEEVVRLLGVAPDPGRTPLFGVLFNYEPPQPPPAVAGLTMSVLAPPAKVCMYDLMVVLRDHGDSAELHVTYLADRYAAPAVRRFAEQVLTTLAGLATGVPDVSIVDAAEVMGLGTGPAAAGAVAVHELVAEQALAHPDRVAFTCGADRLTYRELHEWAGAVAARLGAAGVEPGARVGVRIERSTAMVAAVLGVLRAGAAYVPADPEHPAERISAVFADAGVAAVLTGPDVDAVRGTAAAWTDRAGDDAYVIYTSGTTGEPKGVVVGHGNLAASTAARRAVYPGAPVFLLVSPLAFDSSVAGLWGTLTSGGELVVAETADVRDPARLLGLVDRHAVTDLLCVPSLYGVLLPAVARAGGAGSLRRVIVAGEALPEALLAEHFRLVPGARLVNEYGPTEATVWASYREYAAVGPVDIGGPIPGARLHVLDDRQRLVPRGVAGELYVGGAGVALGYLGRPAETALAFVPDPFGEPESRLYRTGDLVRWSEAGTLEFLGRLDQQVKIRGHRVELGAIETAVRSCAGVRDVVVVPAADHQRLVGFLTAAPGLDPAATRARVAELLPGPMVPAELRVVEAFPLTPNGKIDREALAGQTGQPVVPDVAEPAADDRGDVVASVAAAWRELLGVADVPVDTNFFDAGGHSLLVPALQVLIEDRTGTELSIVDLFAAPTVTAQAELVRANSEPGAPPVAPAEEPGTGARRGGAATARARRMAR